MANTDIRGVFTLLFMFLIIGYVSNPEGYEKLFNRISKIVDDFKKWVDSI